MEIIKEIFFLLIIAKVIATPNGMAAESGFVKFAKSSAMLEL